ncbi:hypothetical protein M501DRAFT_997405 [Patellaria atrata CBS 101060]|uniref:Uncharacterized protein n=1 Tax=Patellaria atrata CBS 101060 TaxID=1346257 RepID=A0A9P4VNX3_9PEZI|nr:hypothetical protein M501DRAFT_997405 [Patellaria atrata CBS 101060]
MAIPIASSYTSALPSNQPMRLGSRSDVFRPPRTPSYSASTPSTGSSRKRSRHQSNNSYGNGGGYFATPHDEIPRSVDAASPVPFVNTRYTLAGGLDTPGVVAQGSFDADEDADDEGEFRKGQWSSGRNNGALFTSPNDGRQRIGDSLGKLVVGLVGGVIGGVGKAWDFCTGNAFRGFYAGGGRGYDMPHSRPQTQDSDSLWQDVPETPGPSRFDRDLTPVPGRFPEEDDFGVRSIEETPMRPPAKRQHTETNGSGWVVVNREDRASSPRLSSRKVPTLSSFENLSPRRNSQIPRPAHSRTASRKSLLPVSRRTSSYTSAPSLMVERRLSYGAPKSAGTSPSKQSPMSEEAKRYLAKMRREEKETDESIRKFGAKLSAMIKEGKQALGTKVEVEDDNDDGNEGYFGTANGRW